MLISRRDPNFGREEYFCYTGDRESMQHVDRKPGERIRGWLIECRVGLMKKTRFVFYGSDDKIYLHSPDFLVCCSDGTVSITCRKWLVVLFVDVRRVGMPDVRYRIHVPITRYLFNDGMFPDEVEPLYEVLTTLEDPAEHQRIARLLSIGIALE